MRRSNWQVSSLYHLSREEKNNEEKRAAISWNHLHLPKPISNEPPRPNGIKGVLLMAGDAMCFIAKHSNNPRTKHAISKCEWAWNPQKCFLHRWRIFTTHSPQLSQKRSWGTAPWCGMAARAKSLPGNQKKIIENHSYWVSFLGVGPGLGHVRRLWRASPRTACDISLIYTALYKHSGHEPDEWDAGLSCWVPAVPAMLIDFISHLQIHMLLP